jgi:L-cysteine:1D-myo-inositol 2-amino-2-deoxy-alpha-D-glucopyranoside ligase
MEVAPTDAVISEVLAALADNLDTVRALSAIKVWIEESESGSTGGSGGELSRALDSLLGIAL